MNCNDCGGFLPRGCECSPFGGRVSRPAPPPAPKRPQCAVRGLIQPGAMCGSVIVGGELCGFKGQCEHQRPHGVDACATCGGARGGVPGNENMVDGKPMCDYCHADAGVPGVYFQDPEGRIPAVPAQPIGGVPVVGGKTFSQNTPMEDKDK
jgi:hypothetical protein